jgi:predicted TIM-barrel fold metal-dependent hydrolase
MTRRIVDAHCHIGRSLQSGVEISEEALLGTMASHGVATALVMPQPYPGPEVAPIHDRIAHLAERQPGRIHGIANLSPLVGEAAYRREVERCVRELGFRAVKLHPLGHAIAPNSPRAEIVFALAKELGVPVIVHTGTGIPQALPALAIPPALAYPDVTVVLAHAGFAVYTPEALVAAQLCPNVILEPSWCMPHQIAEMVRSIGAERVLFGSDHLDNVPVELAKFAAIGLDEAQLAAVLAGTATRVFGLPDRPPER